MNADVELTMLVEAGGMELQVAWRREPAQIPAHAAAHIAERWEQYVAESRATGRALFNGGIAQLLAVRQETGPAGGRMLVLELGPADYKSFLVTRLRDRLWFERHAPACAIRGLGNSALVTHGDQAILGRRSPQVSSYAGRLHLIGGVLEALDTPELPASRAGIEAHLLLELSEELGLEAGEERRDGWPRVLALAEDEFLGQPELFWQWEVTVELEALRERLDEAEHSGAVILGRHEMTQALWEQFTPVAREAWRIWTARGPRQAEPVDVMGA